MVFAEFAGGVAAAFCYCVVSRVTTTSVSVSGGVLFLLKSFVCCDELRYYA